MPDNDLWLAVGLGAAVALGVMWWMNRRPASPYGYGHQPALVQHNVMRDEHGRIVNVETFRGLHGAGQAHPPVPAEPRRPATRAPEEEEEEDEWGYSVTDDYYGR